MASEHKKIVTALLLAFVGLSVLYALMNYRVVDSPSTVGALGKTLPVVEGVDPDWAVYFFYNDVYCETCEKLEGYALEAVQADFQDALDSGALQWRSIDMTTAEHEHYAEDFQLFSKSVVLVELGGDEEVRWENLEDIWDLVHDKPAYMKYIQSSLADFMDEAQ